MCVVTTSVLNLYANYLMTNLKNVGVGMNCGDELCPGLMYADDHRCEESEACAEGS